jgi:undecaprenyl-diphosphatase
VKVLLSSFVHSSAVHLGAHLAASAANHHAGTGPQIHYWQAIILGILQGITELFPVSSIGHTVIFPALFGWNNVVAAESAHSSFWLAFVIGLHVGTALALLFYYRNDWVAIIRAFFGSLRRRRAETADERLAWLLIVATIPAGIMGLLLENELRLLFTKPLPASIFLIVNGCILMTGEWYRRRASRLPGEQPITGATAGAPDGDRDTVTADAIDADGSGARPPGRGSGDRADLPRRKSRQLASLQYREAGLVGVAQVLALVAGISRSGITMVAGLVRGLSHEDAARFAFLLATPVILLAGIDKLPDLLGTTGNGVRGQTLAGAAAAAVAALLAVQFLTRWFKTGTLIPFAVYCLLAGAVFTVRFA